MRKSWDKGEVFFNFFFSAHPSDQMSEGSQVSNVTLCVEILKWQWPTTIKVMSGQLKSTDEVCNDSYVTNDGNFDDSDDQKY